MNSDEIDNIRRLLGISSVRIQQTESHDEPGLHLIAPTETELKEAIERALKEGIENIWIHSKEFL
jgi:hypothetical protein